MARTYADCRRRLCVWPAAAGTGRAAHGGQARSQGRSCAAAAVTDTTPSSGSVKTVKRLQPDVQSVHHRQL